MICRKPRKHSGDSSAITRNSPAVSCTAVTPSAAARPSRRASGAPGSAMTTVPPTASGSHRSKSDASKAYGAWASTASSGPTPHLGSLTRPATLPCGTRTPFGSPVEPEVYMTYAASSAPTGTPVPPGGQAATAAITCGSSSTTVRASSGTRWRVTGRVAFEHSTTTGAESASRNATRSAGYPQSTGTYAAPARHTPSSAVSKSADRSSTTATRSPRRTPRAVRYAASRLDAAANSSYVSLRPVSATATASGVRATWRRISSGTETAGAPADTRSRPVIVRSPCRADGMSREKDVRRGPLP